MWGRKVGYVALSRDKWRALGRKKKTKFLVPENVGKFLTSWRNTDFSSSALLQGSSYFLLKGPAADATDAPQPWRLIVQPYDEDDEVFSALPL
jgi:hypothetical protein